MCIVLAGHLKPTLKKSCKKCFRFNAELAWMHWQQQAALRETRMKFGLSQFGQKEFGLSQFGQKEIGESPLDLSSAVRNASMDASNRYEK